MGETWCWTTLPLQAARTTCRQVRVVVHVQVEGATSTSWTCSGLRYTFEQAMVARLLDRIILDVDNYNWEGVDKIQPLFENTSLTGRAYKEDEDGVASYTDLNVEVARLALAAREGGGEEGEVEQPQSRDDASFVGRADEEDEGSVVRASSNKEDALPPSNDEPLQL